MTDEKPQELATASPTSVAERAESADEAKQRELESSRMPLWEHLDELRSGIIRSLIVVSVGLCATYTYSDYLVRFLEEPLLKVLPKDQARLYFTGVADKFMVYLKVSLLASVALVIPYLLWEVWRFVSPALYRHEKKFVGPFLILGTVAFFSGLIFSYYIVIPYGYKFLIEFGAGTVSNEQAMITLTEYFDLTVKMLLILGLVFELPVVLMLLGKMGLVRAEFLAHFRRHAFLAITFVSAVLTPSPDAFTLILVAIPLYLLYELSIFGVRWVQKPLE